MRQNYRSNDDTDFEILPNGKKILRDGKTYHAGPITMMDSAMRPVNAGRVARVTDGSNDPLCLHRPGWRVPTTQDAGAPLVRRVVNAGNRAARQASYDSYHDALENSWRGDAPPAGAYPYTAAAEGKSCTVNGAPGTLVKEGNWLVCKANNDDEEDEDESDEQATSDAVRRDHRSVDQQMMRDHQNKMADIYDKLDHELSEAWRRS